MISTQYTPDSYSGNGVLTTFAFNWRILAKTDLVVTTTVGAVVTIKVLDTDYTIANADVNTDDGGDVVFVVAPATGTAIVLSRDTAMTQLVNLTEGGPFPAAVITKEFDRLTMMIQELSYRIDNA